QLIASVATCDIKSREARLHSIILELDPSTLALTDPPTNQDTNQEDTHPELVHLDTSLGKIEKLLLAHQVTIDDDIAFFFSLMKPLEARSTYWSGRSFRLLLIALSMNHKAGNPINATQLTTAVIMHDISMAFLPLDILHKSTVYNADERKIVQNHAISSHQLLKNMNRWAEAAEMVLQHHEHFDGMGYPEGLSDEHICHGAKVLAIIDAYDAITHERAHTSRVKRPFIRAVLEINSLSGSQFSPYWIEIFNSVIKMLHARGLV
ncbi:MAG: HD domain-containing protein, partial [Pseudomonadales bacterium]|nr:HD domain-containing protein [Pseudomonadales bacterium]